MNTVESVAHNVTTLDTIAGFLVVLVLTVSVLTLFGMGILMAVGAVFSNRPLVTSWPADQEHAFSEFERRGSLSNSRAWAISLIGAFTVTIFAVGVYFGVKPDIKDFTKDMNMSNLTKKRGAATSAPKPDSTTPAEAPKPVEAPKSDTTAPAPEAAPKQ